MAHISHLYEDRDMTLDDIASIAFSAAKGTLAGVTQKLDGANLVYTCTSKFQTRVARNESDIKAGGMIGALLEAKFIGRGLIQETFVTGFEALKCSMLCITTRELAKAFENAHLWYSTEIIYTSNPNVVNYEENTLVLHERPVLCFDGNAVVMHGNEGFQAIEAGLKDMNEANERAGWKVCGPQRVTLSPVADESPLMRLISVVSKFGRPSSTLQDCLYERARDELKKYGMSEQLLDMATLRLAEMPNAPTLTVLRTRVPSAVAEMLRASDEWIQKQIRPLELAVSDFAMSILNDIQPSFIADPEVEAWRIRENLTSALKRISTSRNQHAIDYTKTQMEKLQDVSRLTTPLEGIVFPWKDKVYKLTGAFAPANAILGLCRYGRGRNIPPIV